VLLLERLVYFADFAFRTQLSLAKMHTTVLVASALFSTLSLAQSNNFNIDTAEVRMLLLVSSHQSLTHIAGDQSNLRRCQLHHDP